MLLVLGLAYALWRSKRRAAMPPPPPRPAAPAASTQVQAMVACAHCGVHLPHSEALAHAGQHYCSAAHRDAGAR